MSTDQSNTVLTYREKEYDVAKLARVTSQGVEMKVALDKINLVATSDSPRIAVVASGENYDMVSGSLQKLADGTLKQTQVVYLLSKPVLKKALKLDETQVQSEQELESNIRRMIDDFSSTRGPRPGQAPRPYGDRNHAPRYGQGPRPQGDRPRNYNGPQGYRTNRTPSTSR